MPKKNLSKLTIQKMRAVIKAVLAEPEFYDQSNYPKNYDCGLECCSAGWAVWLDNPRTYKRKALNEEFDWQDEAEKALGLGSTGSKLFWGYSSWPSPFADMYRYALTPLERAKAMAARWERFIATDGKV